MQEWSIAQNTEGRTLLKFLSLMYPKAPKSVFYKALRENKIKIDRKKPKELSYVLSAGEHVQIYFTDEQAAGFGWQDSGDDSATASADLSVTVSVSASSVMPRSWVIYEDDNLLIVNKPSGVLTQKSRPEDVSLTEMALGYLLQNGYQLSAGFTPGFVQRLDRNTGGLMMMGKTLKASAALSEMIREHKVKKVYAAVCEGAPSDWEKETTLRHSYHKDSNKNKAIIGRVDDDSKLSSDEIVICKVRCVSAYHGRSGLLLELISGKSHQLRAQLAFEGYPLVGDTKYGGTAEGKNSKNTVSTESVASDIGRGQWLFAWQLSFDECPEELKYLEGKTFTAPLPEAMQPWFSGTDVGRSGKGSGKSAARGLGGGKS